MSLGTAPLNINGGCLPTGGCYTAQDVIDMGLAYSQAALQAYGDSVNEVHEPGYVSFEGYLAGRLFVDGLAAAPSLDTDGLVTGLESLHTIEYGIGTTLSFTIDDHQASDRIWGTQLDAEPSLAGDRG